MKSFLCGAIAAIYWVLNTLLACLFVYPLAILKLVIPLPSIRAGITRGMIVIAETWVSINSFGLDSLYDFEWDFRGLENLDPKRSYLVVVNHQSWTDIVVLQKALNRKIPFPRFFLKQELLYVPLLGLAWWALDFPFMKRYSPEYLQKHPEKRGEDLKTTQKACEKFRGHPITILNFLEGTRFTKEKHDQTNSPFQYLLSPKVGGVAFVIDAMKGQFHSMLDITIYYPQGPLSLWQMLSGKLKSVVLIVDEVLIPLPLQNGDYMASKESRKSVRAWVYDLWSKKDQKLKALQQT